MRLEMLDNKSMLLSRTFDISFLNETVELSPLTQYIHIIHCLMQESGIDLHADSERLFFRGQADENWPVVPNIFRDDQLSLEHKYVRFSLSRLPAEFSRSATAFDRLAKLQHYSLPTRLLDVTHNPMVALYFACAKHEIEDINEDGKNVKKHSNGAVYIAYANPEFPESLNTQVISNIATLDLSKMDMRELWNKLNENVNGLPPADTSEKISDHLQSLTKSHFVMSDLSNERLIRQCGSFLVCGCINIDLKSSDIASTVSKATQNLQTEFSYKIAIDVDEKEAILDELDFYNINEATLFPELEHQLKYVALTNKRFAVSADQYRGIIKNDLSYESTFDQKIDPMLFLSGNSLDIISRIVDKKSHTNEIVKLILSNATVDWQSRDSIQAKIVSKIKRFYVQRGYTQAQSTRLARTIVDKLVHSYYASGVEEGNHVVS